MLEKFWVRFNRVNLEKTVLTNRKRAMLEDNYKLRLALRNYMGGLNPFSHNIYAFSDQLAVSPSLSFPYFCVSNHSSSSSSSSNNSSRCVENASDGETIVAPPGGGAIQQRSANEKWGKYSMSPDQVYKHTIKFSPRDKAKREVESCAKSIGVTEGAIVYRNLQRASKLAGFSNGYATVYNYDTDGRK